jgi:hypothetical protein
MKGLHRLKALDRQDRLDDQDDQDRRESRRLQGVVLDQGPDVVVSLRLWEMMHPYCRFQKSNHQKTPAMRRLLELPLLCYRSQVNCRRK